MAHKSKLSKGLSGAAGEYFVAAELSRRGYIATVTLRNTEGIDILASTADASRTVGIQVKTNQRSAAAWVLGDKVERAPKRGSSDKLFFVFVRLNGLGAPQFHVVSRRVVAQYCRDVHQRWLMSPSKSGRPHKDNPVRRFEDREGRYLDRWEVLGLGDGVVARQRRRTRD